MISAKLLFNVNGPVSRVGMHLQQAIEKSLKGWLIVRGWELVKTHNLELLLDQVIPLDPRFGDHLVFARTVTKFYITDRYPPINRLNVSVDEMKNLIETADRLIELLKEGESK